MDQKLYKFFVIISLAVLLATSCKEKAGYQDLQGNWTLIKAMRNGRPTSTLENVYFDFKPDTQLTTNILGMENTFDIIYKYPNIKIENSSELEALTVKNILADTLHMELRIMNYKYDFFLLRSE